MKILKRVLILLFVAGGGYLLWKFVFAKPPAGWDTLSPEKKVDIIKDFLAGKSSIYIRPGSEEFKELEEEAKQLFEDMGLPWDQKAWDDAVNKWMTQVQAVDRTTTRLRQPSSIHDRPGGTSTPNANQMFQSYYDDGP